MTDALRSDRGDAAGVDAPSGEAVPVEQRKPLQDRVLGWAGLVTAVLVFATLAVSAYSLPAVLESRVTLRSQQLAVDVASCRGEARSASDLARDELAQAESERVDVISLIVSASIRMDIEATNKAEARLVDTDEKVGKARTRVIETARTYYSSVTESRADPASYVRACKAAPR